MSALHTEPRPSPTDLSDTDAAPRPAEADDRPRLLDLSLTQLVAGSMAAATAAALGSRIGVLGTITGAALGSVVSAVAASLYVGSLARARHVLRSGRRVVPGERSPLPWKPMVATSAIVFALAAAFLTGVQLASGKDVTGTSIGTGPRTASSPQVDTDGGGSRPDPASTGTPAPSTPATEPTTTPAPEPSTATATATGTATTSAPGPDPSPSTTTPAPTGEPTAPATTGPAVPTPGTTPTAP